MAKLKTYLPRFCFTLLIISFVSCNDSNEKEEKEPSYSEKYAASFSKTLNLDSIPKTELSPEADEALADWSEFMNVKSEIDKFDDFTLQQLINNTDNLTESIEELQDSIPEQFDTTPVQSRINVLTTKTKMLQQYAAREELDTLEIQDNGRAIYTAFSNLKIQMNEIFLKQLPEFEVDLDRKQDSIRKAAQEE